jgi:hypothetical protein
VLFLVAARAWSVWRSRRSVSLRSLTSRRRLLAAALVGCALALSVGPSLVGWVRDPWPPPWFAHGATEGAAEQPEPERP